MARKPKHPAAEDEELSELDEADAPEVEEEEAPELYAQATSKHASVMLPPQPPAKSGAQSAPLTSAAEAIYKLQWFMHG